MISKLRGFSNSKLAGVLVGIIIIPFVFWGMGDVFRGGNQNVIATIDSKKVSTQEFMNYLNRLNLNEEEIVKRDFTILCGSIGLIRSWSNLEVSLATMITGRTPDLDELYSDGPHLGTYSYEIGQPNLTLERTISIEGSLQYSTSKSQISLTGYHNLSPNYHISTAQGSGYEPGADWIEWGSGSSGWLYKYQMKGLRARIYGWESEMRYELNNWFNLNGNVSVTRGDNLSQDRPLEYMPPDKVQFSPEVNFGPSSLCLLYTSPSPRDRG